MSSIRVGASCRVLVVEDNGVTRRLLREALQEDGIEVFEATRAAEAGPLAAACEPDLVLLDLVLPDGTGLELLEVLRAVVGPATPILALTGLLPVAVESLLASSGFDDIVYKPTDPARLRQIVRAYLPRGVAEEDAAFGAGLRLLLVEHDAVHRKLSAFRLARLGFDVECAADGIEALAAARATKPHVVVSDLLMPHLDGYGLCVQLRADADLAEISIILLTNSYIDASDRALAAQVGADAYVIRSAELTELIDVLRDTLHGTRSCAPHGLLPGTLGGDRSSRTVRQLERQVVLNAALTQRSTVLAAELAIVGGLARALATNRDADAALDDALTVCFDAGGIDWGILLVQRSSGWSHRSVGLGPEKLAALPANDAELVAQLGLHDERNEPYQVDLGKSLNQALTGLGSITPIVHQGELLGALVLGFGTSLDDHRVAFAGVVAGQLALVLALRRSIEELERISTSERNRAEILASIVDAIGQPLLVLDADGTQTFSNAAADNLDFLSGYEREQQSTAYFADQSRRYEFDEMPAIRALHGEAVTEEEMQYRAGTAASRWVSVTARPVRSQNGKIHGAVAIVRDVTDEKRHQARQIAADRLASVGVLAAGVAHEINNPLTSVIAEIDMALEDLAPEHVAVERMQAARDAAQRVRTIVDDLRMLSREGSDLLEVVDLQRAVDTAIRMATPHVKLCATVVRAFEPVPVVMANEQRLVQVFLNFLVNAAQAIGEGRPREQRITVRVKRGALGQAIVEIEDTGPGMRPEVQERLFTPFFTTKAPGTGTGLGLSICHRIVTATGGTIDCESTVGSGTLFRVHLPSQRDGHTLAPVVVERRVSMPMSLQILVVEEDPLAFQIACRALRPQHHVMQAISPTKALQHLEADADIDVIICDLQTQQSSRADFVARMNSRFPELVRCILLTGNAGTNDVASFPRLAKPYSAKGLREFVEAHGVLRN